jgi:hypothetical protein
MELWGTENQSFEEDRFVEHIETLGLRRDPRAPELSKEEIRADLMWLIDRGYLRSGGNVLAVDSRLEIENHFIRSIAGHCLRRPPSQSDVSTTSSIDGS